MLPSCILSDTSMYSIRQDEMADLADQNIATISEINDFQLPHNLQVLKLDKNKISTIDETISQFKLLRFLNMSSNLLTKIQNLSSFSNLTLLDLSRNKITKLENLENNVKLKRLLIGRNVIQSIKLKKPLASLILLDIHHNPLTKVNFGKLFPNLVQLYINECRISSLKGIETFPNLKHFKCQKNKINDNESYMLTNPNIEDIDISRNEMTTLAPFLNLTTLKMLNIKENPLTDASLQIPSSLRKQKLLDKIPHLQTLIISKTKIQSISLISKLFPNIEYIDISQSQISNIEDVISFVKSAKNLKYLDLLGNPLTKDLYPTEFSENVKSNKDSKSSTKSSKKSKDNEDIYESIILFDQKYEKNSENRNSYRQTILQFADSNLETLDRIRSVSELKSSPKCSSLASSSQDFEDDNNKFAYSPNKNFRQKTKNLNDDDYDYVYEEEEKQNNASENENEIASDELEDSQDDIDTMALVHKEKLNYNEISIQTSDDFINQMIEKVKKEEEEKYKDELEKLKSTQSDKKEPNEELTKKNQDLENEIKKLNENIDKLQNDKNHLNEELTKKNQDLENEIKKLNENINKLQNDKNNLNEELTKKNQDLENEIKKLNSKIDKLKDDRNHLNEELTKKNQDLENEIKKLNSKIDKLKDDRNHLNEELKKANESINELNQSVEEKREMIEREKEYIDKINSLNETMKILDLKCIELDDSLKKEQDENDKLSIEAQNNHDELKRLKNVIQNDQMQINTLQREIKEKETSSAEEINQIQKQHLDALRKASNDNNQLKIEYQTKLDEKEEKLKEAIENIELLNNKIKEKDLLLDAANKDSASNSEIQNQILKLISENEEKENQIQILTSNSIKLKKEIDSLKSASNDNDNENQNKIIELTKKIESIENEKNDLKSQIDEKDKKLNDQNNQILEDQHSISQKDKEITKLKLLANTLEPNSSTEEKGNEQIQNLFNEIEKLKEENVNLSQSIDKEKEEQQKLKNQIDILDQDKSNLNIQIDELTKKLNSLNSDVIEKSIPSEKVEKNENKEIELNELQEKVKKLNDENVSLTQKNQDLLTKINQKDEEINLIKQNCDAKVNENEEKLNESKAQNDKLQEEINQLKKDNENYAFKEKENQEKSEDEINKYEAKLTELKEQNNQLQDEINQLKKDKEIFTSKEKENQEKSENKINELKDQNKKLQEEINQLRKVHDDLTSNEKENQEKTENEINELKDQNKKLQEEINQLRKVHDDLTSNEKENQEKNTKEINEYEAKLAELKAQNDNLQGEINQLKKDKEIFTSKEKENQEKNSKEINEYKTKLTELKAQNDKLQDEINQLKLQDESQTTINFRFIFNRIKETTNKKKNEVNENINKNILLKIDQKLKEKEKSIQQIMYKVASLNNKMNNKKNVIQSLNSEKSELLDVSNKKIEEFKKLLAQKTDENESLKAKIKSLQNENQYIDEDTKDRRLREYSQKIDSLNCLINHLRSQLSGSNNQIHDSNIKENCDYKITSSLNNNNYINNNSNSNNNNKYQLFKLKNQLNKMKNNLNELKESFEISNIIKDLNWMKRRMMNEFNKIGINNINSNSFIKERKNHSSKHNKLNNSVQTKVTASNFDVSEKLYLYDKKSLHELVHKKTKDIYHHLNSQKDNNNNNKENQNESFSSSLFEKLLLSFERQNQTIIEQLSLIRESFKATNSMSSPNPFMSSNTMPYLSQNSNAMNYPNLNQTANPTQFQNQSPIQFRTPNLNQTANLNSNTNHSLDHLIRLVSEVLQDNRTIRDEIISINKTKEKNSIEKFNDKNLNANSKLNSNRKENHHAHKKNDKTLTFNDLDSEVEFIDFTDNSKSSHRNKSKSPISNKIKRNTESSPLNYKTKRTKHSVSPSPKDKKSNLKKKSSRNQSEKAPSFSVSGAKKYSFSSYDNEYGNIIYHENSKDNKKFEIIQKNEPIINNNNNKTSLIDLDYIENSLNYNTEVTENNISFQFDRKSNFSETKKKKKNHLHQKINQNFDNGDENGIQKVHYPSFLNPHVSTNSPTKSSNFTLSQGLMSISDCENVILKEASKKNFIELSENSDEFKCVRFWLSVSLRKDAIMKSIIKINSKADFASFKANFKAVHPILVLLPVESMKATDLNSNSKITIQNDAVVFRYLSRIPKSFPQQFFLCATDLGIQSVQTSLRMEMPSQQELLKIQTAGYDSFIFNHNGIENILIFNPLRIIPLYYISI